tara:strand:+ start:625 stop:762 length:138 start_codon:yes stop_codon:yes gene_type:complete
VAWQVLPYVERTKGTGKKQGAENRGQMTEDRELKIDINYQLVMNN